jgi:TolB-like protein
MGLISELKRRNVHRMAALYAAAAWLVMQVVDVVEGKLPLLDWIGSAVLAVLAVGFPIALVISWFYEVTPEGISRDTDEESAESTTGFTGRRVDFAIIAVLCAAVLLLAYELLWTGPPPDRSVAVLPFADMSPNGDQEYFGDGIAEELLNELVRLDGLRVAGRTSSFSFKGTNENLSAIAEALNVGAILEGSVRKDGDRVRITAQLINASDGYHLWSKTYDRELADIFAIQEEIATSVSGALGVRLGVGGVNAFQGAGTRNIEAYEAYLQSQNRNLNRQERIRLLERAIELDPNYAVAWSSLGSRTLSALWDASPDQASEFLDRAYSLVLRGVQLNPESAVAQYLLAQVRSARFDWIGAEQGLTRAIELLADRPTVAGYANVLLRNGRTTYAQRQYGMAKTLEPLGGRPPALAWHASLAQGRFAEAKEISNWQGEADRIENNLDIAFNERDPEELKAAIQALSKTNVATITLYAPVLAEFDSPERILSILRDVYSDENLQWPRKLHDIAMVAAYFGDPQFALKVKGQEVRTIPARLAAVWYPVMSEVRRLPGFKKLVTELNLVEYWRTYGWADLCRPLGDDDFECI